MRHLLDVPGIPRGAGTGGGRTQFDGAALQDDQEQPRFHQPNVIKSRVVPCYIFQATALVTGLALILLRGLGLDALVANPVLGLKFLLLLVISGLLSIVHFNLQPRLDALFAKRDNAGKIADADAAQIRALRTRRKQLSATCMFFVLTVGMLGVQARG